jgi:hypothetical protein
MGLIFSAVGLVAFLVCVAGYGLGAVEFATAAGIAALLSSAAGLACLSQDGRRARERRPLR